MIWWMILERRVTDADVVVAWLRNDIWIRRMLNGLHFSREFTNHALRCASVTKIRSMDDFKLGGVSLTLR
jgi:hypothetical protein